MLPQTITPLLRPILARQELRTFNLLFNMNRVDSK